MGTCVCVFSYPAEADLCFAVADGVVLFGLRRGALGSHAVAVALEGTLTVVPALGTSAHKAALGGTARTLTGTGGGRGGEERRKDKKEKGKG